MARIKFRGGVPKSVLSVPRNNRDPIPRIVTKQFRGRIRIAGVSTSLYQQRQSDEAHRDQYWSWITTP